MISSFAHRWILVSSFLGIFALLTTSSNAADQGVDLDELFSGKAPTSVADLKAMEQHVQAMVKKVRPTVVGVRVGAAQGSGVIISEDGYVLTAAHVNGKPDRSVTFIFPDGSTRRGKTLGVNKGLDSGLMKIEDEGKYPFVEMGDSTKLKVGQWITAIGHPNGYMRGRPPVVRVGRVLSNRSSVISTDAVLVGGDSGGPLFNMAGEVIGIHSRIGGPLTANMHVPVNTYRDTWDRLTKGDDWGLQGAGGPYIGVQGDPDSDKAKIARVYPDAPAEKAGLEPGDIITMFNGEKVKNFADLASLVGKTEPKDRIKIEIERDGIKIDLEMTIGVRS